ncbi:ACT domain-containing protein [Sphaerothrix gracilis]|uniref:ACT domain-containing protein n=1 Tax=Sphaerothrix gracilis TaxID=3151835 RepID=UPI0031FCAE58
MAAPQTLILLPQSLAICRLAATAAIPDWAVSQSLLSVTRTDEELSLVCDEAQVPEGVVCDRPWQAFQVAGPLDFSLTGILASLLVPLAEAEISIFAVSTYNTDYLLVRQRQVKAAIAILGQRHRVILNSAEGAAE